jgi:hypothetical protein
MQTSEEALKPFEGISRTRCIYPSGHHVTIGVQFRFDREIDIFLPGILCGQQRA